MRKIHALIADDEPLARQGIALMAKTDPEIEIVGTSADGAATLEAIRRWRPDLVYLDVEMPGLDGFQALRRLPPRERPMMIFITAHSHHAARAFEVDAVDYLLKPLDPERFLQANDRAKKRLAIAGPRDDLHAFRISRGYLLARPENIAWIEAQDDAIKVRIGEKTHLILEPLHQAERRLDPVRFIRVHRSFIVNLERIRKISTALYGDWALEMEDGAVIPVSRSYRATLRALLPIAASSRREADS